MLLLLVGVDRHVQSTQNSKFVISLQYLKTGGMKLVFLHADNYQTILKVDINFGGHGQAYPDYPK